MTKRLQRRQGVVYGPLVQHPADSGSVLGQVAGGLVIIGALGILALVGLTFVGDGPAAIMPGGASPSPTAAAVASPTPTSSPTPRPTVPSPTPDEPDPTPSPEATPFPVEVQQGGRYITFGADYRTGPARIVDPTATFAASGQIAWLADLGSAARTREVQISAHRVDPSDGSEEQTYVEDFTFRDRNAIRFLRRFTDISDLIDGPGIYVVRYSVNDEVRSEGYFRVEEN